MVNVKQKYSKHGQKKMSFMKSLRIANPIVLVLLGTPLFLFLCISVLSHSILHKERKLLETKERYQPNTLLRTEILFKGHLRGGLVRKGTLQIWDLLLQEAELVSKETNEHLHVLEVGMNDGKACVRAANHGISAHCIEPSPVSNNHIMHFLEHDDKIHRQGIHFYKTAAAAESDKYVPFQSGGFPQDHVGKLMDIKTMSRIQDVEHGEQWMAQRIEPFLLKTVAIDDLMDNKITPTIDFGTGELINHVYLAKIETQGYEPEVIKGMEKAIVGNKIDFIMMEFWPKGIDFMEDVADADRCKKPVALLQKLIDNGYTLYALPVSGYFGAPKSANRYIKPDHGGIVNYNDLNEYCKFFYEIEEKNPSEDYKMGYFSEVLAVSPNARLPYDPKTELGQMVQDNMSWI